MTLTGDESYPDFRSRIRQQRRQEKFGGDVPFHEHQGEDIAGGVFSGIVLSGDFRSTNWDGVVPANLATRDTNATTGFYFDSSLGSVQIMGDLFLGGSIVLDGSGLVGSSNFSSGSAGWQIEADGSAEFNVGIIGGWVLTATALKDAGGLVGLSSVVTGGDDIRFFAGHATPSSAPFKVTEAGVLTATSGAIGGWAINASTLVGGNLTLASSGNLTAGTNNDVVRISGDDATYRIWVGNATAANGWSVDKDGVMSMSDGTAAAPAVRFHSEIDWGIFRDANGIGFTMNGVRTSRFEDGATRLASWCFLEANDGVNDGGRLVLVGAGSNPDWRLHSGNDTYTISSENRDYFQINDTTYVATFTQGRIRLAETTAPTPVGGYGDLYTATDNKLYFVDGGGTTHEVAFV